MLSKLIRKIILKTPYGKNHLLLNSIKEKVVEFEIGDDFDDSVEKYDELISIVNSTFNKVYAKDLGQCVPIELDEADIFFLKNSIKSWDKLDYAFLFALVSLEYLLITQYFDAERIESYSEKHSNQSGYVKQDIKFKNMFHKNMPGDTIPEAHLGGNFSGRFRVNGKIEGSDVNLNHRLLYGHDLFKVHEIFESTQKIDNSIPVKGSVVLGKISKTFWHLWYDTYSETGIPVPGSTYFLRFLTEYIVDSNDEFIKFFTVHHEDIILQLDIGAIIELYFKTRNLSPVKDEDDINTILKRKHKKTFKEYEMKIIAHMICLNLQLSTENNMRGKINHITNSKIIFNLVKYMKLNKSWKKTYSAGLKYELNRFECSLRIHQKLMEGKDSESAIR